jgi:lysophospholipase L1-like esterase
MRAWLRRALTWVTGVLVMLVSSAVAIWLAIQVTPMQSVSAAGQTVQVGAASPNLDLSGPGELDLFGQVIATRPRFDGPIRPRLELTHITVDAQVGGLVHPGVHDDVRLSISRQLAFGWERYCLWETIVAGAFAALLLLAISGLHRASRTTTFKAVGVGVVTVCALNTGGVYLLASSTPRALQQVRTLDGLVARSPDPTPRAAGPTLLGVQALVLGDSTAAGLGNQPVDRPTTLDRACGRSKDSYASDLATVNNWQVLNLACSGATVRDGVLGVQVVGGTVAPPQLAVAQRASTASVVIVSVGANDVQWAPLTALCAHATACNDEASTAYYQKLLASFTQDYNSLLQQLADLPQHPTVLINEYYNPFGHTVGCLDHQGLTTEKVKTLDARLAALNTVLHNGAQTFDFTPVEQHFAGHELCSAQPYVQGLNAPAPLHPTAAGEIAIALADQQALYQLHVNPQPTTSREPAPNGTHHT